MVGRNVTVHVSSNPVADLRGSLLCSGNVEIIV